MTTTLNQLKSMTLRLLDDTPSEVDGEVRGAKYSADLLLDATRAALVAATGRLWKASVSSIAGVSGSALLPDDFIEVEGILDLEAGKFLPENSITPLGYWSEEMITGNAYMLYPEGSITFVEDLPSAGASLYYTASWNEPTSGSDPMDTPDYANTALSFYCASYCAASKSVTTADIGQYKVKVDSGTPTDNPLIDLSNFLLNRFNIEIEKGRCLTGKDTQPFQAALSKREYG